MKNKKLLLGGLLLLGVGFAAVTTTLYITGTTNIKADTQGFENDVVFKTVEVDATSAAAGTTAEIVDDGKKITFITHGLKSIGEEVTISYTIENKSQYGAKIGELVCTPNDAVADTYLTVAPANTLKNNNVILAKQATSDADTVVVTMVKSFAGGADETTRTYTYSCTLPVTAVESN